MELGRWYTSSDSYDVENDFHGIFFPVRRRGTGAASRLFRLVCFAGVPGFVRKQFALLTPEFVALLVSLCDLCRLYLCHRRRSATTQCLVLSGSLSGAVLEGLQGCADSKGK